MPQSDHSAPPKAATAGYSASSSHYWADWDPLTEAPNVIRKDTRIFWKPQAAGTVGSCVGTFIGENPGGAESVRGSSASGYSPIHHRGKAGDGTLRLLLEIWQAAVRTHLPEPMSDDYIEILNTYYFRNPKSGNSLAAWRQVSPPPYFQFPSSSARFVLLGWGVQHNNSPEAVSMVAHLRPLPHIIVPDSSGRVAETTGLLLPCPVAPAPVAPSYILRNSRRLCPSYVANIARALR